MQKMATIEECTAHQWWPFWKAGSHTFHPWSCAWPSADKLLPRARAVFGHSYTCIPILPRRVYLQSQCWQCQAIFQYVISNYDALKQSQKKRRTSWEPIFIYAKITCKEAVSCAQLFDHYWRFCLVLFREWPHAPQIPYLAYLAIFGVNLRENNSNPQCHN